MLYQNEESSFLLIIVFCYLVGIYVILSNLYDFFNLTLLFITQTSFTGKLFIFEISIQLTILATFYSTFSTIKSGESLVRYESVQFWHYPNWILPKCSDIFHIDFVFIVLTSTTTVSFFLCLALCLLLFTHCVPVYSEDII